jgi:hypothetical protein
MSVHSHRSLNRIYTKEKVVPPATLTVFLKHYSRFILFYKPLDFIGETQRWIQILLQRLDESNLKEKTISVEQLSKVLQQFDKEWDEDHVRDYNTILDAHADNDYEIDGESEDHGREMPTPEFEKVLTDFAREVIRYAPSELIKFAQRYFKALETGKVEKYLQKMADQRAKLLAPRLCTEDDLARAQDYLSQRTGDDVQDLEQDRGQTIAMIQETLAKEAEERKARALAENEEQRRLQEEREAAEAEERARVEREVAERNIDMAQFGEPEKEAEEEQKEAEEADEDEAEEEE